MQEDDDMDLALCLSHTGFPVPGPSATAAYGQGVYARCCHACAPVYCACLLSRDASVSCPDDELDTDILDLGLDSAFLSRPAAPPQSPGHDAEDEDDLMEAALAGGVRMSRPVSLVPTDPQQSLEMALAIERSDSSQAVAKLEQQERTAQLAAKTRHRRSESVEERKARIEADDWSLDFGALSRASQPSCPVLTTTSPRALLA
jgi:hypothetical protein